MRAVIYCRCSTEEEAQKDALFQQVREAEECVRQKGWIQVDSYVESKSGTTTKGRDEYNRLFKDMAEDKFEIIVIKSQDRLMRRTKDWYLFVDRLVTSGKRLYMYLENKFYTPDDALITGIKAILAEEYSSELSKKINNAHRNRQNKGEVFVFPPNTYGLRRVEKGKYELVEEEAKAIQTMFHLIKTNGCGVVADILEENGLYDRNGKPFEEEAIRRIIRNPIRCGTVVQNKKHFDFQSKKVIQMPKEAWVIHRNAVPACVTEEEWAEANQAMDERAAARNVKEYIPKGRHIGRYDLSGKIKCGFCGHTYFRSYRKRYKDGTYIIEWKCSSYLYHGRSSEGCHNILLNEEKLFDLLQKIYENSYRTTKLDVNQIIEKTLFLLEKAMYNNADSRKRKRLEEKLKNNRSLSDKLLDKLLQDIISNEAYQAKKRELDDKKEEIEKELGELQSEEKLKKSMESRISVIRKKLEEGFVEKAAVSDMIDNIRDIRVFPDHLEIRFCIDKMLGVGQSALSVPADYLEQMQKVAAVYCAIPEDFVYQRLKKAERERIIKYMKEQPAITAKEIAALEGVSKSAIDYRIKRLRNDGRIYFDGKGGKGKWVVVEEGEN